MKPIYKYIQNIFCLTMLIAFSPLANAQEVGGQHTNLPDDTVMTAEATYATNEVVVERLIKPADQRAYDITEQMRKELKLTDEQAKKVYVVNLKAAQEMDAIRKQYKKEPEKIITEGQKVSKEHDQKLSNILQPHQWAAFRRGR